MPSILAEVQPMGIYQMLYAFMEASGSYMGEPGTHPWSQGFPLTMQLPGGPPLPPHASISSAELKYPKAWGHDSLRQTIAKYYRDHYGAELSPENVMIFSGGRGALFAVMFLLRPDVEVLVEETEYTPYYDLLQILQRRFTVVPSNETNGFLPSAEDYASCFADRPQLCLRSNPCNPTGQLLDGARLEQFVAQCTGTNRAALIDEAYEFFADPQPVSALAYVKKIDETDIFVAGAATKGLQAPGIRVGWIVASRENINKLANYSTFAMGGVSRLSQNYAEELLHPERVDEARKAVCRFYSAQRDRYGEALSKLGIELFTGRGGFYHWGKLPGGLTADEFNSRLFREQAAILPGRLCDMHRRGAGCPHDSFFRFSFGPLLPESFESDIAIMKRALGK